MLFIGQISSMDAMDDKSQSTGSMNDLLAFSPLKKLSCQNMLVVNSLYFIKDLKIKKDTSSASERKASRMNHQHNPGQKIGLKIFFGGLSIISLVLGILLLALYEIDFDAVFITYGIGFLVLSLICFIVLILLSSKNKIQSAKIRKSKKLSFQSMEE